MSDAHDFTKMVPGFDFLQGLMKNAGSALPNVGQWVAPTLDPEELGKRIEELRTVQFWLEQNARLLATTIQALEVQRMTLSTLKTMNVQVGDMAEAFKVHVPGTGGAGTASAGAAPKPAKAPAAGESAPTAGVVDPMQWWGALTQQFTQLAAQAMKDAAPLAGAAMAPKAAKAAPAAGDPKPASKSRARGGKAAPAPSRSRARTSRTG